MIPIVSVMDRGRKGLGRDEWKRRWTTANVDWCQWRRQGMSRELQLSVNPREEHYNIDLLFGPRYFRAHSNGPYYMQVSSDKSLDQPLASPHRRRSSVNFRRARNFCPKNMYEKLTKCLNFFHKIARKNISLEFWGLGAHAPRLLRLCAPS